MVLTSLTTAPHYGSRLASSHRGFSLPVSIRSLDGRFATITVQSETSVEDLRAKIALELGIPGSQASQLSLTMATSTATSRNQQVRTETLGTDIRSVTQLSAKAGSSNRCNLIAENCKDLSPKIAFEVTKIMKHWLSPALRSHRSTQRALLRLREITSAILEPAEDGATTSNSHPRRLNRSETERFFSRVARGMELLKKIGFSTRTGSDALILPREADLRPLQVVHGMMVENAVVMPEVPVVSALARRRAPRTPLALSPRHPVFSRALPSPSPRRSQHNHDNSEDEAKEPEVEVRSRARPRRRLESPVNVSTSRRTPTHSAARRVRAATPTFRRRRHQTSRQRQPAFTYESLSQLQDVQVGLDKRIMNLLPLQMLDEDALARIPKDCESCGICLMEWGVGDVLMRLPCMHFYHQGCLEQWFISSKKCPHDMKEVSLRPGDYGLAPEST